MSASAQLLAWLNGTPTGGPNADGRYPLTGSNGETTLVFCPAAQALNPTIDPSPIDAYVASAAADAAIAHSASLKAGEWATKAEDSAVETGLFSAMHWAKKAKFYAENPAAPDLSNYYTKVAVEDLVNAVVIDSIADADTTHAPSRNAVFDALALKIDLSKLNVAGGVAGLDGSAKLNPSTLPALAITDTFPVTSEAAMLALTAEVGDVAIRSDINKTFILRDVPASTLANWNEMLTPTTGVSSVFGRTGAVTAQAGDYTFAQLGSKPTTRDGFGITDVYTKTQIDSSLALKFDKSGGAITGNVTVAGTISTTGRIYTDGAHYASTVAAVVLSCSAPGMVYLRPNGADNDAGQVTISQYGTIAAGALQINSAGGAYFGGNGSGTQHNGSLYLNGHTYKLNDLGNAWLLDYRQVVMTAAAYAALGTKDANTMYLVY